MAKVTQRKIQTQNAIATLKLKYIRSVPLCWHTDGDDDDDDNNNFYLESTHASRQHWMKGKPNQIALKQFVFFFFGNEIRSWAMGRVTFDIGQTSHRNDKNKTERSQVRRTVLNTIKFRENSDETECFVWRTRVDSDPLEATVVWRPQPKWSILLSILGKWECFFCKIKFW